MPTQAHVIFIPSVLLVGFVLGYLFGVSRATAAREREERRMKE